MNYLVPDAAILDIVKKIIERSNRTLEVAENLFTGAGVGVKIKKRTQNTHIKYISNHWSPLLWKLSLQCRFDFFRENSYIVFLLSVFQLPARCISHQLITKLLELLLRRQLQALHLYSSMISVHQQEKPHYIMIWPSEHHNKNSHGSIYEPQIAKKKN